MNYQLILMHIQQLCEQGVKTGGRIITATAGLFQGINKDPRDDFGTISAYENKKNNTRGNALWRTDGRL
jgi:hypothetical protein